MRIEQTVEVDAPLERVWALVNDVPRVAPCMPGGALTRVVDDKTYEGTVQVKLGPIRMSYKGTVVLEEVDEAARSAKMSAKGRDVKGSGTAAAQVVTRLEPGENGRTKLHVISDVQLTGKVASFGRGAVQDVAGKLFGQFADCLVETLKQEGDDIAAADAAEVAAGAPPATERAASGGDPSPPPTGTGAAPAPGAPPATEREASRPPETPAGAAADPASTLAQGAPPATERAASGSAAAASTQGQPLEVGGLVGTVIVGRIKAFFAAIARFFRRR